MPKRVTTTSEVETLHTTESWFSDLYIISHPEINKLKYNKYLYVICELVAACYFV